MKSLLFFRWIFLFSAPVFFSCAQADEIFSEHEEVEFTLPRNASWKIMHAGDAKTQEEFCVTGSKFHARVRKNSPQEFIAREDGNDAAAGCIYPYSLTLSENGTFAASVLNSLVLSSETTPQESREYLAYFNWPRFIKITEELGSDAWKLDKEKIMSDIARGKFKVTNLKPK